MTQGRLRVSNCVANGPSVDVFVNGKVAVNDGLAQANLGAGAYALVVAGLGRATPVLTALGLFEWQNTLVDLRLRLPRAVYQACVRQTSLLSYANGVATLGVVDLRMRDALEFGYTGALRLALSDALGHDVTVRVVTRSVNSNVT
jgi:hypothetical protein